MKRKHNEVAVDETKSKDEFQGSICSKDEIK